MELYDYGGRLEHDTFYKIRPVLSCTAVFAILAAALHGVSANRVNCTVDLVCATLLIVLIVQPTWLGLVGMMTFSLTLLCSDILLLATGIAYEKLVWSPELLKNTGIAAYAVDIIYTAAVFISLNFGMNAESTFNCYAVWERPSKSDDLDDQDSAIYNEQDDVWAPFSGNASAVNSHRA
ncbi:cytochrome c oxidase subunit I [Babesia ovata]|uniref:Cytochrome c oxidase subunit I n=1 Tax=Babesia ovata TaxID=189622 RepID=A0A2H6KCL3_9APIC|nr:cytochrome c oxidase subunit I [Babesia ovata]GBE60699.1 cytochrome c oxidase subunit I [Babesia ovata]